MIPTNAVGPNANEVKTRRTANNGSEKPNILIVEDEPAIRETEELILKLQGYNVACAGSPEEANKLVADALSDGWIFKVAFVDMNLEQYDNNSGGEIARRLLDIGVRVVVATGFPEEAIKLPFAPDETTFKPFDKGTTLSELASRLLSMPPPMNISTRTALILWEATKVLKGINSLKKFSRRTDEEVEKLTAVTMEDGKQVNFDIYVQPEIDPDTQNIGLSATLGCYAMCIFCRNWRGRIKNGEATPFERRLTTPEIIAQFYIALCSVPIKKALDKNPNTKIRVNFTIEGDSVAFNLHNSCNAIQQMSLVKSLQLSFIMTSVGNEESLDEYIKSYLYLPITHYFSLISSFQEIRDLLVPGAKGQSIEKILQKYAIIGNANKRPVTVSIPIIHEVNDTREDAEQVVKLLKGGPFLIKLMCIADGSLTFFRGKKIGITSTEDVERFKQRLIAAGFAEKDIRIRINRGINILSGCGWTPLESKTS